MAQKHPGSPGGAGVSPPLFQGLHRGGTPADRKTGWLSNNLAAMAEELDTRWLIADYEAGDMVVHSPYMVHASTMNVDPEKRIRLSTDIRYQCVRDEIDVRWNNHWSFGDML
jgi:hypothetical protein